MVPSTSNSAFKPPVALTATSDQTPLNNPSHGATSAATPLILKAAMVALNAPQKNSSSNILVNALVLKGPNPAPSNTAPDVSLQSDTALADFAFENEYETMRLTIDAITTQGTMALNLPLSKGSADVNDMHAMIAAMLKERAENQKRIDQVKQVICEKQEQLNMKRAENERDMELANFAAVDLAKRQALCKHVMKTTGKMQAVFKDIEKLLKCPLCKEVALLPKALGCGHTLCQSCIKTLDDETFKAVEAIGNNSQVLHVIARRCPCCKETMIGQGLPVYPLKHVAELFYREGLIAVSEMTLQNSMNKHKIIAYEESDGGLSLLEALQFGSYAHVKMAEHVLNVALAQIKPEDWIGGIVFRFYDDRSNTYYGGGNFSDNHSNVFINTFYLILQAKVNDVYVSTNLSKRELTAQLINPAHTLPSTLIIVKAGLIEKKVGLIEIRTNQPPLPPPMLASLPSQTPAAAAASAKK